MLSSLLSSLLMIVPGKGEEKAVSEGPLVVYWDINRLSPVNMLPNAPPVPPIDFVSVTMSPLYQVRPPV